MSFKCNYCQEIYKVPYSRVKAHLLRIANVAIKGCPKVTAEHKLEMQKLQDAANQKKISKESTIPLPPKDGSESISNSTMFGARKRRLIGKSPLERAFNNGCKEQLTSLIARMFYSGGIPFHFARNPHYVNSYKYKANNMLVGYVPPGYNALRTTFLQKERANVERMLKPIKDGWKEKGAIDGTKEYKDKYYISELLMNVIKEIGPEKVVQVITDNAYVMKAAGSLIEAEYPHIFWTPCVVHTLNLALKNICAPKNTERNAVTYAECNWIAQIADDASFIRVFIMNHSMRCCYGAYFPKLLVQPCSSSCCERNWSTYSFIHSLRRNKMTLARAQDLVFVHSNLRLLSRSNEEYIKGPTKMWDIAGDSWEDPYGGVGMLEIASLTLDEPELEEEIMGATSETVGGSAPADSESVGDGDDEEDVVVLG
uniref:DUF659 domain-containing protein n=1 Tax=Fagus sylvatica TaxID=28930 RepID=A0A2N9H6R9_FAGSY